MGTKPYRINEGALRIPEQWDDKTVNVFSASREVPSEFSIVITREDIEPDEDLKGYKARQMEQITERLPGFHLINESSLTVDGTEALEAEFAWSSEQGKMIQRQVYLRHGQKAITFTASALRVKAEKYWPAFKDVINSFKAADADR